jgi:hypothetical protein
MSVLLFCQAKSRKRAGHACSLLPIAENGGMTFGQAAKGQANELV